MATNATEEKTSGEGTGARKDSQDAPTGGDKKPGGDTTNHADHETKTGHPVYTGVSQETINRLDAKHKSEIRFLTEQNTAMANELAALRAAVEEQKNAGLSESERLQAENAKLKEDAAKAKHDAEEARQKMMIFDLVSRHAPTLPVPFRQLVSGKDEDTIMESITALVAEHDKLRDASIRGLAHMPLDEVKKQYGSIITQLASALAEDAEQKQPPGDVGSQAGQSQSGQVTPPPSWAKGQGGQTLSAWLSERKRRGYPER